MKTVIIFAIPICDTKRCRNGTF